MCTSLFYWSKSFIFIKFSKTWFFHGKLFIHLWAVCVVLFFIQWVVNTLMKRYWVKQVLHYQDVTRFQKEYILFNSSVYKHFKDKFFTNIFKLWFKSEPIWLTSIILVLFKRHIVFFFLCSCSSTFLSNTHICRDRTSSNRNYNNVFNFPQFFSKWLISWCFNLTK